ncbi:hypothetical protein [Xenorhabdus sp. PB62.4]|uniref:hypothetical protein n=1 Tax=Xenorhabdus sp. PB62.4 TaxID=1851573 RepID=UPI001656A72C|nr:hypothetical protein [Xenorhabdus sp. PB62.4]MBC8952154.1 hypothetical protein [Xenorhabdus sp. PB62.4]
MNSTNRDKLVALYEKLESSFSENLSNDDLRKLVDLYMIAISNYDRDIMDSISFYVHEYGNRDTKEYILNKIKHDHNNYLEREIGYLIDLIK